MAPDDPDGFDDGGFDGGGMDFDAGKIDVDIDFHPHRFSAVPA